MEERRPCGWTGRREEGEMGQKEGGGDVRQEGEKGMEGYLSTLGAGGE